MCVKNFILVFSYNWIVLTPIPVSLSCRKVRYEVDGYVYNKNEEPKFIVSGNWNKSMSYQPCDAEGEPTAGTDLKEVRETLNPSFTLISECSRLQL